MDWNVRTFQVAIFQPFTEAANWTIKRWKSAFFTPGRGTRPQQRAIGTWVFWKHWDGVGLDVVSCKILELCLSRLCDLFFGTYITNLSNHHQRGPAKRRTWGANMLDHVGICLPSQWDEKFPPCQKPKKTPPTLPYQVWLSYFRLTEFSWD